MAIDNFDLIKPLLKFEDKEDFYFVQVLQRKKDFEPGQRRLGRNNNNRLIKPYYIYSVEQLDAYKEEIIKLCEVFNARAGINLNRRNNKDVAIKCLEILAIAMRKDDEFKGVSKIYSSACGKESSTDKLWIVDIDTKEESEISNIEYIIELCEPITEESKIIAKIPTKNGVHLITKKFNRQTFKNWRNEDIHLNNPSLLYCP